MTSANPSRSGSRREALQQAGVLHDEARRVEGADQVLAARVVDADLPADRRVDHRQQRRRALHERHAAQVRRRDEAGEVADDAAAKRDDGRTALRFVVEEPVVRRAHGLEALAGLAGGNREERGLEAGGVQGCERRLAVLRAGVAVADHERRAAEAAVVHQRTEIGEGAPAAVDLVCAAGRRNGDHVGLVAGVVRSRNAMRIAWVTSSGVRWSVSMM